MSYRQRPAAGQLDDNRRHDDRYRTNLTATRTRTGPQLMNTPTIQMYTHTPTEVVRAASGIDFGYRRVGNRGGTTLLLANYFAANMDDWDPLIVDGLATNVDVY